MKPDLILGMGNPLMGDDGAGCRVAELLARHPDLPGGVEVPCGGSDLLCWAENLEGRRRVILLDALLGED